MIRLLALAVLGSTAAAQFQVWTVDDDGPADFSSIQAAIDAAQNGDALLLRGGTYLPATIDAKRLTILADDGEVVSVPQAIFGATPALTIQNTGSAQPVTIVGLNLMSTGVGAFGYAIGTGGLQGTLWIQDAFVQGVGGMQPVDSYVVVRDSILKGDVSTGFFATTIEGHGVEAHGSLLRVYGSTLEGAIGANAGCIIGFSCGTATTGGDGLFLRNASSAHLSGVVAQGGHGQHSFCDSTSWGDAGSGGDGVHVELGSQALEIDSTFLAGAAGQNFNSCSDGTAGLAEAGLGAVTHSPYVRRSLTVNSIAREGETVTVTITSPPNESVFVGTATTPGELQDPLIDGPLILGSLPGVLPLGPMPANGRMHLSFPAPVLPPGVDFFTIYLQAAFAVAPGVGIAGDPMALVILDSAF